jgi:5'-methylthioadenosine phosphorylase
MLGIIGGSGLYDLPGVEFVERVLPDTPYGFPSDEITIGRIEGRDIAFLSRHGRGHRLTPTELPYQANIYALKAIGVTRVVTVSAVGSLREDLPPRTAVLPDQIFDRTVSRPRSFFGEGAVAHVGIADPFCPQLSKQIVDASLTAGRPVAQGGTYICIEGPQFSTKAESRLFRSWGGAVIGMTAMPEARLAREAELCYATIAMVTDFDVWHESAGEVTVDMVVANHSANLETAQAILRALVTDDLGDRACGCGNALQGAIVTDPAVIPPLTRTKLGIIADRYLPPVEHR